MRLMNKVANLAILWIAGTVQAVPEVSNVQMTQRTFTWGCSR